ncbi:MAG: nuclear transport factor 2 family protein [Planctomycetota bacterium]
MSTYEVAKRLVELCKAGEHRKAIEELYADDATAYEAVQGPMDSREMSGKAALLKGSDQFFEMNEVHGGEVDGPYPCDDKFICFMSIDLTPKAGPMEGQRFQMSEACLYTVKDGKIARSEFFYHVPEGTPTDCTGEMATHAKG